MESSLEREQLMPILQEALQRQPEERGDFVRGACDGDQELHQQLVEALQWEERMGSFLLEPLVDFTQLARPFEPGQVVAERFEILREIGEGGMGVVYEAFDRKRQQRIAIKAAKPGFQRLLSPELKAALKVRHHNICLVNEIHTAQTERGEIDFLTMEFLEGETLSAHLAELGKLAQEEAFEIACQLCAGLAEAHHSGIIHRDLKTGNILLCRNEDGSRRAVITDFGLAGGLNLGPSEMGGTPGYMAPELWQGGEAGKLSDVYALGVILHEMVTGRKPSVKRTIQQGEKAHDAPSMWTPEGSPQTIWSDEEVWRKREEVVRPLPPSTWTKHLDPRWDLAIMGCLEPSPAERTQDVAEVLAELQRKRIPKWPFVATGLLIVVLAGAIGLIRPLRQRVTELIWPPNVRLVVLPYDGPTELAAIGSGALQDVSHRLSNLRSGTRSVIVISPSEAKDLGVTTPEQAQKTLHATHALQTRASKQGDDTVVQGSIIDLEAQTHVRDFSYRYRPATQGALPGALAGEVAAGLGLRGGPAVEVLSATATGPYDRGLYLVQQGQNDEEVVRLFEEAARLDPRSPLPLGALVKAEIARFEDTKDASHLNRARQYLQTAESLNPDSISVHLAAARLYINTGKLEKALDEYLRVKSLAPTNMEATLRLADVYDKLDMPEKAIREYRKAIELDPTYFGAYSHLGVFYYYRGNYSAAAEQFKKAIEHAPGNFQEQVNLISTLMNLRRDAEAEQAIKKALQLRTDPDLLEEMGALLAGQGRDAEAVPYYERAAALKTTDYTFFLNLGDSNRHLGRLKAAREDYRRGLRLAQAELQQNPQNPSPRAYAAYFAVHLGDRTWAQDLIAQALHASAGNNRIVRLAVLTYEALGLRNEAIASLATATPELLKELDRESDLAELRQDSRFTQLVEKITSGGK